VARAIDRELVGSHPSKATFYRWLSGNLTGLPHPSHCRILAMMIPGWTVQAMFEPWAGEGSEPAPVAVEDAPPMPAELAGVTAVYTSRTEFSHEMPPTRLFDSANVTDAVGPSLNLRCDRCAAYRRRRDFGGIRQVWRAARTAATQQPRSMTSSHACVGKRSTGNGRLVSAGGPPSVSQHHELRLQY
jgi:hypothetical protein